MKKILSVLCASTLALSAIGMVSFADSDTEPEVPEEPREVAVTDFGAMFYVMGNPNWNWASAGETLFDADGKWQATVDVAEVAKQSRKESDTFVGRAGVLVYFCEGEYYGEDAMFKAKMNYTVVKDGEELINKNEYVTFLVVKKGDGTYEATTGDSNLVLAPYETSWDDLINYGTVDMTVTMTGLEQIAEGKHPGDDSSKEDDSSTPEPTKQSISKATVKASNKTYTGKALKPSVKVTLDGKTLKSGTDYSASYKNNTNCGKATVTVTGKGSYTGKKSGSFIIKPKKATAKKLSSPKKGTVKFVWKKSAGGVTGYQVQIATNKKFNKNAKTYTVKKAKTTSKTIKKLSSKKTYFARVRAYKTVGKKNYTGSWSAAKKVVCK